MEMNSVFKDLWCIGSDLCCFFWFRRRSERGGSVAAVRVADVPGRLITPDNNLVENSGAQVACTNTTRGRGGYLQLVHSLPGAYCQLHKCKRWTPLYAVIHGLWAVRNDCPGDKFDYGKMPKPQSRLLSKYWVSLTAKPNTRCITSTGGAHSLGRRHTSGEP